MTTTETKTYLVGVVERAIAYYKVEAKDARLAAQDWEGGDFYDRDDEALEPEGPCNVRERQPDGTWRKLPPSEWAPAFGECEAKPFSVLLLHPPDMNDTGYETYYAFVVASDSLEAVAAAQRKASAAQEGAEIEPDDFRPLLVTQGHQFGEPLFNR